MTSKNIIYLTIIFIIFVSHVLSEVCSSSEYCPDGWAILRKKDGSAQTCEPIVKDKKKCPKPYMCIASKCGISFCCVSERMKKKLDQMDEEKEDDDDSQEL